jgi:hypothetical protein
MISVIAISPYILYRTSISLGINHLDNLDLVSITSASILFVELVATIIKDTDWKKRDKQ